MFHSPYLPSRRRRVAAVLFFWIFLLTSAGFADNGEWLETQPNSVLTTGDVSWTFAWYDANWKWVPFPKNYDAKRQKTDTGFRWEGQVTGRDPGESVLLKQQVDFTGRNQANLTWSLQTDSPLDAQALAWQGKLPVSVYAGQTVMLGNEPFTLPEQAPTDGTSSLHMSRIQSFTLPVSGGAVTFTGPVLVQITDGRVWKDPSYVFRVYMEGDAKPVSSASLAVSAQYLPYASLPLNLGPLANRTFADEVAGDGKGGWTDQGPENDLRGFSKAKLNANGVNFLIPDTGPSVVVLSGNPERSDLNRVEVPLPPAAQKARYLYLLHGAAWVSREPVGSITFDTPEGPVATVEMLRGKNIGNWWRPSPSENAAVAWTGAIPTERVGLYLSRFELPAAPVSTLVFESASDAVWMIVGAAVSPQAIPLPRENSFTLTPGGAWRSWEDSLEVVPDSILDFSAPEGEPAGSKGGLIARPDGTFAFADDPDTRVKLFGASLNFGANFQSKPDADRMVRRLKAMGYNTVRIHHLDVNAFGGWGQTEYVWDEEMLDRLDYLFFRCKQEGMYVTTELFHMRRAFDPELRKLVGYIPSMYKALIPFSDLAMNDWKRFARDLLGRTNPYTGMTWAEDPTLVGVCPVNEDTLWAVLKKGSPAAELAEAAYRDWLREQGMEAEGEIVSETFNRFLVEAHLRADAEMKAFLKKELGYKGLVTGNNWRAYQAQTPIREAYDYVDNHGYWDHPSFPKEAFKLPANFSQRSATAAQAQIPRDLFLSRVEKKPFVVTEYNYALPNRFRSEGGALAGAYAALQDWDGMFRFAWAHDRGVAVKGGAPGSTFDMATDPVNRLAEAFVYFLWFRGDVESFPEEAVYTVGAAAFETSAPYQTPKEFPDDASRLGLTQKVSSRFRDTELPEGVNSEFRNPPRGPVIASGHGSTRTRLELAGNFMVETPFSKAAVLQTGSPDKTFVTEFSGGPAAVLAASRDGKPLAASTRILVLHLTDALASEMVFGGEGMYSVLEMGRLPSLIRSGSATLQIPDNGNGTVTAYAVAMDGRRLKEVQVERSAGFLTLQVNTTPADGTPRMVYEILRGE